MSSDRNRTLPLLPGVFLPARAALLLFDFHDLTQSWEFWGPGLLRSFSSPRTGPVPGVALHPSLFAMMALAAERRIWT